MRDMKRLELVYQFKKDIFIKGEDIANLKDLIKENHSRADPISISFIGVAGISFGYYCEIVENVKLNYLNIEDYKDVMILNDSGLHQDLSVALSHERI